MVTENLWNRLFNPRFTCAYCKLSILKTDATWSKHAWGMCVGKRKIVETSAGVSLAPNSTVKALPVAKIIHNIKPIVERTIIE